LSVVLQREHTALLPWDNGGNTANMSHCWQSVLFCDEESIGCRAGRLTDGNIFFSELEEQRTGYLTH
ncbi:hypothetical protein, partial [Serratia sp. HMSC15F11]|uniref:hypothetical protein n=1 Tax=Serratia sp. HMSC15F11 TaxID=1581106 RepID=UPI001FED6548